MSSSIKKIVMTLTVLLCFNTVMAREELVLNEERVFNPTHHNRFAFMLGLNPSVQKAGDVTNFNFSFAKKMDDYWLDTNLNFTSGVFTRLTTNNPAATTLIDDQLAGTKSTHTVFGLGVGRETRYAQTLLPFTDIYELMAANLTYNLFKEPTSTKTFNGPGMLAKFSLYKRFSEFFSAGTQFTYNLAVVKRAADNDLETSSARSLTISYLTVGFDLSFYL